MFNIENMLAIYCRISKNKKAGQDKSIQTQKAEGVKFANRMGFQFEFFVDEGISGTKELLEDRPEFADMLNLIEKGTIKAVYCIDQSRIERNSRVWNLFVAIMLSNKCEYYPDGKIFDLNEPENLLLSGMMSLTNEFYASLTSRKVKLADALNAKEGKTHGMTAYGYKRGEKGYYEINEDEAKVVRRIYNLSIEGKGVYTIAKILNDEGIPTRFNSYEGKIRIKDEYTGNVTTHDKKLVKWRGNVIHDIIRNPIYKGIRKWNDLEIKIAEIIDPDIWEKTNNNLETNKKNVGRKDEYHYLLNGLMFCAHCGKELRGKKRLKGVDKAYKCKGKRQPNPTCPESRGINIPKIETFIIKHLFESKELKNYLLSAKTNESEKNATEKQLLKKKSLLEKTEGKISKAYKILLDPDFTDDTTIMNEIKSEKKLAANLKEDVRILEEKLIQQNAQNRKERLSSLINDFSFNASFDEIKKAVHAIVSRITIFHGKALDKGYYLIKINYKNFIEESMFRTDYQSFKWYWISRSTDFATNAAELQDDIDLANAILRDRGITQSITELNPDFKGFQSNSSPAEIIKFNKDELIHFD